MKKYIFIAGAPGSRWSGVAKGIYSSADVDQSDYEKSYTKPGESKPMHIGAYWDPGMEYGNNFDKLNTITKDEAEYEFNRPFKKISHTKYRVIKSHQFCKHLNYIKRTWSNSPIVCVYFKNDNATESWWYEAGGFDITYPDYKWYKGSMRKEIEIQNAAILQFIKENKCERFGNSYELSNYLELKKNEFVDFEKLGAYAFVYRP